MKESIHETRLDRGLIIFYLNIYISISIFFRVYNFFDIVNSTIYEM